jgi:hypothetical protein
MQINQINEQRQRTRAYSQVFDDMMRDALIMYRSDPSGLAWAFRRRRHGYNPMDGFEWYQHTYTTHTYDLDTYQHNTDIADSIGKVEIGVSDTSKVLCQPEATGWSPTETCCPVCLDTIETSDDARKTNLCDHVFCNTCITRWLKKSKKCPVCMQCLED